MRDICFFLSYVHFGLVQIGQQSVKFRFQRSYISHPSLRFTVYLRRFRFYFLYGIFEYLLDCRQLSRVTIDIADKRNTVCSGVWRRFKVLIETAE